MQGDRLTGKLIPYAYAYVLLAISQGVDAQVLPSAGSLQQQIPPAPVAQPVAQPVMPNFEAAPRSAPKPLSSDTTTIVVERLSVTGAQVYSATELLALTGFVPGSELTLTDLRRMATKIADHYHLNGYFLAQAYLPAQDIQNGVVNITVVEGRYGAITLNNQTTLSDDLANGLLTGLGGELIESAALEERLLLLSDLPGIQVRSTLVPGDSAGTSDLQVALTPGPRISGEVDADNAGNYYTGEVRLGATVNLNNLAGLGDVASLRVVSSGSGLNYVRAAYQLQLGKAKVGLAYSALEYELSRGIYEGAGFNGNAQIASLFGSYPLIRSRNSNLYAGLAYEHRTFEDKVRSTPYRNKSADVLMTSLYGDHRDNFGGGGLSSFSLVGSSGQLDLETPAERLLDAATAHSNGHYDKLAYAAARLQRLSDAVSLFAAINGQIASKNLDASEKMALGGMYGVRAYPEGEAYGDEGYVLNLEARLQLPPFCAQQRGQVQLVGFVDTGSVSASKHAWGPWSNHRTLSGAGGGLNWSDTNNFMVRGYYAHKLGNEKALAAPDKSGRFWLQVVKYF